MGEKGEKGKGDGHVQLRFAIKCRAPLEVARPSAKLLGRLCLTDVCRRSASFLLTFRCFGRVAWGQISFPGEGSSNGCPALVPPRPPALRIS